MRSNFWILFRKWPIKYYSIQFLWNFGCTKIKMQIFISKTIFSLFPMSTMVSHILDHVLYFFLADLQLNMLGDSININNLCYNPLVLKISWWKKGIIMGHVQNEKQQRFFLEEITKADHQLSETFYFIKISYVLTELWIFFYLEWCFLSKSVISS